MKHTESGGFYRFLFLPDELRLEIWRRALPAPRFIELMLIDVETERKATWLRVNHGLWSWMSVGSYIALPLMQACSEARTIALESYTCVELRDQSQPVCPCKYVDFSRDTFYLARNSHDRLMGSFAGRPSCPSSPEIWAAKGPEPSS